MAFQFTYWLRAGASCKHSKGHSLYVRSIPSLSMLKEAYLDSLNLQPERKLHQQTGNWTATWLFGRLLGPSSELTSSSNYCWGKNIEWFSIHLSSKLTVSIQTLLLLILERLLHRKGLSMHRVLMQFVYTLDTRAIQSMTDAMIQNCTYVLQYTKHNINIHLLSKISKISQEQTNTLIHKNHFTSSHMLPT